MNRIDDVQVDFAAWRKRLGLSKIDAAKALGIGRTTINKFENHGLPVPRLVRLAMVGAQQEMNP